MVFNLDWLPEPKCLKSPRTVFVLFSLIYIVLVALTSAFYAKLASDFAQNEILSEHTLECRLRQMKSFTYSWSGLNFVTHLLGIFLIIYGIYFVLRDSIRLRWGYPSNHPRSNNDETPPPMSTPSPGPQPSCPVPGSETLREINTSEIGFKNLNTSQQWQPTKHTPYPVPQPTTIVLYK